MEQIQEKVASRETELKELEKDVPAEQKELSVAENDLKTVQVSVPDLAFYFTKDAYTFTGFLTLQKSSDEKLITPPYLKFGTRCML